MQDGQQAMIFDLDGRPWYKTSGPRWPWIAHPNFLEDHSQFFLVVSEKNF